MKKIIVTGGAGYIGSHTVVELVQAGYTPVIVDDFSNSNQRVLQNIRQIVGIEISCHAVNCADKEAMRAIFQLEQPAGIIHFAAYKAVGESVEQPLRYYRNNLDSTLVLLELMEEFNVKHFVFSSSCTVYGEPDQNPVTEEAEQKEATSPYGYSKQVCERIVRDYIAVHPSHSACLLRYFNPTGAHPSGLIGELPNGVPNNLVPYITQTAAGIREKLTIHGNDYNTPDGTCIRDFIHVVDLAKAHVSALQWCMSKVGACEAFNLGQGRGNSVLEAVHTFVKVSGVDLTYVIGPRRTGDVEQVWANADKAARELNWKTELSLEDALRDAWKWQMQLSK
jgi:UDP-glucose 4-epimerase